MAPLSPCLLQDLAAHNPIGPPLPIEDVQAWWDSVELRFNAYGYRGANRRRAVISWWARVTGDELERVRERWLRIRAAQLEELVTVAPKTDEPKVAPAPQPWRLHG